MLEPETDSSKGPASGLRVALITLYLSESLGARQLCSVLKEHGHECSLIFFKEFQWDVFRAVTRCEEEILVDLLRCLNLGLVGISITSSLTADLGYELGDLIRARLGIPVILGGSHPSMCPEQSLEHADFVCRGEGEEALVELASALAAGGPVDGIANIWSRSNGEIRCNDVRPLEADLDALPFISFGDADAYVIEHDRLDRGDPMTCRERYHTTASRMSCPFNCSFCAGPWFRKELYAGKGPYRRYRSVECILQEIKQARARHPGIQVIQFWDEVFAVRPPAGWLDEFCERFPKEIGLPFDIWSHPGVLTEKAVVKMKAAGLQRAVLGIESGSQQVRREVLNRRESDEAVLRAGTILVNHGIGVGYDFIVDLPWLSEENCRGTFETVMRLPQPFDVGIHSLAFLPCTDLTERALAEGKCRPEQIGSADKSLPERFESYLWKSSVGGRDRRAIYWHTLIYLASMPFVPRPLLRRLERLRPLLQLYPKPLVVAAEAARIKKETGQMRLHAAFEAVYPSLGGFIARHPTLGRGLNAMVRAVGRLGRRFLRG